MYQGHGTRYLSVGVERVSFLFKECSNIVMEKSWGCLPVSFMFNPEIPGQCQIPIKGNAEPSELSRLTA